MEKKAKISTPESVQQDNFENQIVLLDRLFPKKLSWPKIKNCPVRPTFGKIALLGRRLSGPIWVYANSITIQR